MSVSPVTTVFPFHVPMCSVWPTVMLVSALPVTLVVVSSVRVPYTADASALTA